MTELTPQLVHRAGVALYGDEWQAPVAALLGVNDRTIRRVAQAARQGTPYAVNQGWRPELAEALRKAALQHELRGREAAEVAQLLGD